MKDSIIIVTEISYYILSLAILTYLIYLNYFLGLLISYLFIINCVKSFFIIIFFFCYYDKINQFILLEQYMIIKFFYYLTFVIIDSIFLNEFLSKEKEKNLLSEESLSLIVLYSIDISFEIILFFVFVILFYFYMNI